TRSRSAKVDSGSAMVRKGLWSGARFYTMAEADLLAVVRSSPCPLSRASPDIEGKGARYERPWRLGHSGGRHDSEEAGARGGPGEAPDLGRGGPGATGGSDDHDRRLRRRPQRPLGRARADTRADAHAH